MTIYETPVIRTLTRWFALMIYRFSGWKVEGEKPLIPKYVIIAAPHTSNWDFLYVICLAFIFKVKPLIMMKKSWFFWPLGYGFRWMGAMPIDRSKSNNLVSASVQAFQQVEHMALIVPPSGTRKKVLYWKTGFYHIANGAGVPIVLGYLDYRRKAGGIGPVVHPSGNIEKDMKTIRGFYKDISGKYPTKESEYVIAGQPKPL
jgi:1-acyl-sn-glycerol-3-phosphate acyltransferase